MADAAPVGWWRLDETSGTTASDSSGKGHNGTYKNSPTLGATGAISGSGTAMTVGYVLADGGLGTAPLDGSAYTGPFVEVDASDDFSLVKAEDHFSTNFAAGTSWGDAGHGGDWSAAFTTSGTYYSVDGGTALINETVASATWGQIMGIADRADVDVQLKVSFDDVAGASGTLYPAIVLARYQNTSNYYRAELREVPGAGGVNQLNLVVSKVVSGTVTDLATVTNIGSYTLNDWWYVRFQVEGNALRAKAFLDDDTNPYSSWDIDITDSSITAAGKVGVRSSNSASNGAHPTVKIDDFRVQSIGMTVHAWMNPSSLTFQGTPALLCNGGPAANYVHWLSKADKDDGHEGNDNGLTLEEYCVLKGERVRERCLEEKGATQCITPEAFAECAEEGVRAYEECKRNRFRPLP